MIANLNPEYYEVSHFAISKNGVWYDDISGPDSFIEKQKALKKEASSPISHKTLKKLHGCDIVFPVLHGPFGEDGMMQGFFEILGKPYVGCDHLSAAICMNKVVTKKLVAAKGIAVTPYVSFTKYQWKENRQSVAAEIMSVLKFPIIVKPAQLGSAIGVTKVDSLDELFEAVPTLWQFDCELLAEKCMEARELEFSVIGNDRVGTFPPGEIIKNGKIYDYNAKYSDDGFDTAVEAKLSKEKVLEGMELAKECYKATNCKGMARVDFFFDSDEKFWLNEINPIPGFTNISLYPKMCERHGLKASQLVDKLIVLGLNRYRNMTLKPLFKCELNV